MKALSALLLAALIALGVLSALSAVAAPVNFRSIAATDGGTSAAAAVAPRSVLLVSDCTADYSIRFGAAGTSPVCAQSATDCYAVRGRGSPVPEQSFQTGSAGAVAIAPIDAGTVSCKLFQDSRN